MSTVENNWFRCVSARECDPEIVKGLLKIFKNQIHMLLETIINLVDSNVGEFNSSIKQTRGYLILDLILCLMNKGGKGGVEKRTGPFRYFRVARS